MTVEEIPNSTTSDTEERTTSNTVEEPTHKHGFDIPGHRTGNQPDHKEAERNDIDPSPAIELVKVSKLPEDWGYRWRPTSDKGPRNRGPTAAIAGQQPSSSFNIHQEGTYQVPR